jgi:hypothetical protein
VGGRGGGGERGGADHGGGAEGEDELAEHEGLSGLGDVSATS